MTKLEKAVLEELDQNGQVDKTKTIPVQFNPTSLRLQMTNSVDGGRSRGRQVQQYNGSASTSLSVALEFDTADEGTTGQALDVRARTAGVARFVLPAGTESTQAPPRVQFRWGTLIFAGVMTSLSEELDLFSAEGVPLRAQVSVEIREQDPQYEALQRGPGAKPDVEAPAAGERAAGAGPGTASSGGGGRDGRTAEALDGESAADFLARHGLEPSAWRAISGALDNPLSLSAGLAIDFSASLSLGAGVGVSAGFGTALDVSVGASLGLAAAGVGIGGTVGVDAEFAAGFALAEAGGITVAGQAAATAAAASEAGGARASFGVSVSPLAGGAADPTRGPLGSPSSARTLGPAAAPARALPPRADPRAVTFGRGVPLRDRVTPPGAGTGGYAVVGPRTPAGAGPRQLAGQGAASWERLPTTAGATVADTEQQRRTPHCGCHRCDPLRGRRHGR